MKSAVAVFTEWVPLIPVGNDRESGVVSIASATIKQVRGHREDLRRRIDRLTQQLVALDVLLDLADADPDEKDGSMMERIRAKHPREFDDE